MSSQWKQQLAANIKSADDLIHPALPSAIYEAFSLEAHEQFRMKFPASFLSSGSTDIADALLKQVLPTAKELQDAKGFVTDPVGDIKAMSTPGLIHKYQGRALFIVTGACAIHCRYCFRRHFPYNEAQLNTDNWEPAFEYLRENKDITEIILSGGDPLIISDEKLQYLIRQLENISHIKRLRIHSRIPSVLPERITNSLIHILTRSRFTTTLVTHINHPDEIHSQNQPVFRQLRDAGIQLLNQSVLLADINNQAETLIGLSEKLYENHILPYYLHLLDAVKGAAHFSVKESDAIKLMEVVNHALPGYLVPKLVKEIPGEPSKTRVL